ncbi:A33 protein, partial [Atractosteus spatula]|nr:A33 protein [Atractosteus spatula]
MKANYLPIEMCFLSDTNKTVRRVFSEYSRKEGVTPIPVWKWIREASVDVSLDPNSAQSSLILSKDGKQVRMGDRRQTLPDFPQRFDPVICVLGREGFSSGRHYWEEGVTPIPVWKWIREASVDVSLDPNSAQSSLILSKDGKQVRLGDRRQTLPDSPQRFDPVICVLGREGFSSGRHYWEVEVGEKIAWDLGVAKESINRKGKIVLSPKNGYWTVWLRDDAYKALADTTVLLPLSLKPQKVGIYVDYEEGQVSFYNVETRNHIYTFTDTFTEKLYPYFSPGLIDGGKNTDPLIISPVSHAE